MSIIYINPYQFAAAPPSSYDPDAQAYITAVEAADGQSLEAAVKDAINTFVVGCKADGTWNALKATCILAGARTLAGALVPLKAAMTAPTNVNFVAADYDRKLGLQGNGSTKYLNPNRTNDIDPQNSQHVYVKITGADTLGATASTYIGGVFINGQSYVRKASATQHNFRCNGGNVNVTVSPAVGGWGASRTNATEIIYMAAGSTATIASASTTPHNGALGVFSRSATAVEVTNARMSMYSFGEYLGLALLDARVSTLMSALAAAIP